MGDVFEQLPWLVPVERWHPDAPPLVEEARGLDWLVPEDPTHGLELWAFLGALTQRELERRLRTSNGLAQLYRFEESVPGWPVLARCLVRLAEAEVPGRYLAAATLLELVTEARARDCHRELLPGEWVGPRLERWGDVGRRPFRDAIRLRVSEQARPPRYAERLRTELFWDHAIDAERMFARALSGSM